MTVICLLRLHNARMLCIGYAFVFNVMVETNDVEMMPNNSRPPSAMTIENCLNWQKIRRTQLSLSKGYVTEYSTV